MNTNPLIDICLEIIKGELEKEIPDQQVLGILDHKLSIALDAIQDYLDSSSNSNNAR